MKKIQLLLILWILAYPLFAQNAVHITGTVVNIGSGLPVPNHEVIIDKDSVNGSYYHHVVLTNPNGFYSDYVPAEPAGSTGIMRITTYDCQQYPNTFSLTYGPGVTSLEQNFVICYFPTDCEANFTFEQTAASTFHFHDVSISSGSSRIWDFGDGSTSTNIDPVHTFQANGAYPVKLTIGSAGSACWDSVVNVIMVGDSLQLPCEADFTYEPVGPLSFHFHDISIGGGGIRLWNFGDGTSATTIDPVHTFPAPGLYPVNLTIGSPNTPCTDSEIKNIWVGDSITTGCQAYFHTEQGNQVQYMVYFNNLSTGNIAQFVWDFGDGTSTSINYPSNPNVDHQYPQAGSYYACLTVYGFDSLCSDTYCYLVEVQANTDPCHALYSFAAVSGQPKVIQFTDQSSSTSGAIIAWNWQFGDGTGSTNQNPDHLFADYGTYTVCLTITAANGCTSTYCHVVEIVNLEGCQAYYTYEVVPGTSPNTYHFYDASISSGVGYWSWNFDDGTTSNEQNPIHVFPAGTVIDPYNVCLTITTVDFMCFDTYCHPILPEYEGCDANFEIHHNPNSNLSIYFEDQSEGDIWMWIWNYGDGTIDTIVHPSNPNTVHLYEAPGFYSVCLNVLGNMGNCNSTYCETVAVGDSVPGCQAQFTYFPDSTNTGNLMHFVDLSTGNPTSWLWNFGDPASGINSTSSLQNPYHVFSEPGTYYVCLTIHGPSCESTWCSEVEIGQGPNCANYFEFTNLGMTVNFVGHVLNANPVLYTWDFGDNQSGTGENIVHTYATQGIYYVTLTTTSLNPSNACTFTSGQMVPVGDPNSWHQIYGQVYAGNFPVQQGLVMLFSMDTSNYFVPFVSVSTLDSMGVYFFPMVPQGNFYIYAIPFTSGFLPTYYGDVLNWSNATLINLGTPNNPYDIHLLEGDSFVPGNGTIQGQLIQGDISESLVDKVTMLLKDQNGNVIQYSQVSDAGEFNFPQLAYGTYYLYAELAGCASQTIKVVLSEQNPASQVVLALVGKSILGTPENSTNQVNAVIYPNPVKDNARITIHLSEITDLDLELYNPAGQLTYKDHLGGATGETILTIPSANLPAGIYTLKLFTNEGLITRKLVKTN